MRAKGNHARRVIPASGGVQKRACTPAGLEEVARFDQQPDGCRRNDPVGRTLRVRRASLTRLAPRAVPGKRRS